MNSETFLPVRTFLCKERIRSRTWPLAFEARTRSSVVFTSQMKPDLFRNLLHHSTWRVNILPPPIASTSLQTPEARCGFKSIPYKKGRFLNSRVSHWLEHSRAFTLHLHRTVTCVRSKSHETSCCARMVTIRLLRRRIWIAASKSFLTLLIFRIAHFLASRNFLCMRLRYCN